MHRLRADLNLVYAIPFRLFLVGGEGMDRLLGHSFGHLLPARLLAREFNAGTLFRIPASIGATLVEESVLPYLVDSRELSIQGSPKVQRSGDATLITSGPSCLRQERVQSH